MLSFIKCSRVPTTLSFCRWEMRSRRPSERRKDELYGWMVLWDPLHLYETPQDRSRMLLRCPGGCPVAGCRRFQGAPGFLLGYSQPRWLAGGSPWLSHSSFSRVGELELRIAGSLTSWSKAAKRVCISIGIARPLRCLLLCDYWFAEEDYFRPVPYTP